ncbi:hypothetical protein QWY93_01445 [Echinicola jeungdonensis]|uniref:Uncharacterized protein n=1 Tax=Echinicola jeungdonensis TaxID=709343 RepID=A0ABV5J2W4_9BACT|nr:hypothetical protein [Echinicola jeungdonensis]MDN3668006.1 hypothetical protein [Echinicola jeungdonensis]
MKNIPKHNIFSTPEGYFDQLADQVLEKHKKENNLILTYRWAAAIALVLAFSLTLWTISDTSTTSSSTPTAELDYELEMLIENGSWDEEDMLSFSENPDAVLDQVMVEEWSSYEIDESEFEQELLSY